jgi:hypothetical protein
MRQPLQPAGASAAVLVGAGRQTYGVIAAIGERVMTAPLRSEYADRLTNIAASMWPLPKSPYDRRPSASEYVAGLARRLNFELWAEPCPPEWVVWRSDVTMHMRPICVYCTRLHNEATPGRWGLFCDAFPDGNGIPEAVLRAQVDHRQPLQGDHELQFQPRDAEASEEADKLVKFLLP